MYSLWKSENILFVKKNVKLPVFFLVIMISGNLTFEIILLSCKYLFENRVENKAFLQTVTNFFQELNVKTRGYMSLFIF